MFGSERIKHAPIGGPPFRVTFLNDTWMRLHTCTRGASSLKKAHHLALFKSTTHLDPLLSAGLDSQVAVLIFLDCLLPKVSAWAPKCQFLSAYMPALLSLVPVLRREEEGEERKTKSKFLGNALRAVL